MHVETRERKTEAEWFRDLGNAAIDIAAQEQDPPLEGTPSEIGRPIFESGLKAGEYIEFGQND